MTGVEFGHVLAPGRFDATLAEVRDAWDEFRDDPLNALITSPEHGGGGHDPAFKAAGWDYHRGGELVVSWRNDVFQPAWKPSLRSIGTTFVRGTDTNARVDLLSVPLREVQTGRLVMVRKAHMPAHIQRGDGFIRDTARTVRASGAWTTSLAEWAQVDRRFVHNHPDAALIDDSDWNVDLHRAHWRHVIGGSLGGHCAWVGHMPAGGTHGTRLIDGPFVRGLTVLEADVLRRIEGHDHNPARFIDRITSKEN